MKPIKLLTLFSIFILFACTTAVKTAVEEEKQVPTSSKPEEEDLLKLTRNLYDWHETKSSMRDFEPISDEKDSAYVGLDLEHHKKRLTELKQTGFFAAEFIDNYNNIALSIDNTLKNKKMDWLVGDMPPFGNDANPWCNCQDNPDNYWKTLTIKDFEIENNVATFNWTWGNDFNYTIKAIKAGDEWKITYLQGFDSSNFD
jgi:hypothetical protein